MVSACFITAVGLAVCFLQYQRAFKNPQALHHIHNRTQTHFKQALAIPIWLNPSHIDPDVWSSLLKEAR
jgi:hypothetical protein